MADALYCETVRVIYQKTGRLKYISHLDLNRCVTRALRRSGLPVWHTLGFHPHVYLTFALPLALGYEGLCESFDFRLTSPAAPEHIIKSLNDVLPTAIRVTKAAAPVKKPEAICWADYEINQRFDGIDAPSVLEQLKAYFSRPQILVEKKGKKGMNTVDVKPHIQMLDSSADGHELSLTLRCAAGITLNINPTLLLNAFFDSAKLLPAWTRVVRTAIYDSKLEMFL